MKSLKVCIVGVGAIGTWLGVHLSRSNSVDLSCWVRSSSLERLRKDGLQLTSIKNGSKATETVHPRFFSDVSLESDKPDWVIVCVKSTSLLDVTHQIKDLVGPFTHVLTAMNGVPWWFTAEKGAELAHLNIESVNPGGIIQTMIPLKHWVGAVVHASCSSTQSGVATHHFGQDLIIGEPNRSLSARVKTLEELLLKVGFNAKASDHIQYDIWYKLWGNMTVNPVSVLTGATTDKILDDDLVLQFISSIMLEAKAIGQALGIEIDQSPKDRHAITAKLGAFKTSMLQDLEANRPIELNALVAAVKELGIGVGVKTPFTDVLLGLTRLKAKTIGLLN